MPAPQAYTRGKTLLTPLPIRPALRASDRPANHPIAAVTCHVALTGGPKGTSGELHLRCYALHRLLLPFDQRPKEPRCKRSTPRVRRPPLCAVTSDLHRLCLLSRCEQGQGEAQPRVPQVRIGGAQMPESGDSLARRL